MGKIKITYLALLSLFCANLFAQNPTKSFKHLSLKEGLSQSPIFSIMQDSEGFLWIGSRDGLTRYDGYEFKVYPNEELNKSISQRDINSIQEDADHNLWLATSGGLYRFVRDTEKFVRIPIEGIKFTSSLYPANNNKLWLTTDQGIKILDCKTGLVSDFISHEHSGMYVHTLCKGRNDVLWSGFRRGIRCFDAKDGRPLPVPPALANQLNVPGIRIFSIKEDIDGDLWVGTESSGLFWYKRSTGQCINLSHSNDSPTGLLSNFVKDVFVNSPDEIWVGTRDGLSIFNKKTQKFSNYEHRSDVKGSLSNNTIWKIIKDKAGSIWIATYAGGLNFYNPINSNFFTIEERVGEGVGLNTPGVYALLSDADGGVWVGTGGGGVNYVNVQKGISRYYSVKDFASRKTSNVVKGLARDYAGNLWVATLDGLARFNPSTGKAEYVQLTPSGSNTHIFRANGLLCTEKGIWVAGDVDGLVYRGFDGTLKRYSYLPDRNSISSNQINCLLEDTRKEGVWIGTREGLCYFNYSTGKFTIYNGQAGDYRSRVVISLFRDHKQRLWLGTESGLILFAESGYSITESDGLANNTIQAITEDFQGNLWVSTKNGISKVKFNEASPNEYSITNYTASDGLNSNLWRPNAVFRDASGMLFFGGVNGINYFHPDKIIKNNHIPKVVITDFLVKNEPVNINKEGSPLKKPIELTHSITLKYNQNSFSFKFGALDFINPPKNSYAYKMEGLSYNQDWNYSGSQRLATYTGLKPGTYTFKVKAANNDGVWNPSPNFIKVTVLPPFWATWWAYTFYTAVVLTLFYYIVRFFRRQAKLERDLYYEHLQLERQQELHQIKLNFFTNISHEIRTPLTLIVGPVEKLVKETTKIDYLNKQLRMIQSNTGRLLKLVNELMDFRKTETGNMKLNIQQWDINEFSKQTFTFFIDLANTNNIKYTFEGIDHSTDVFFDYNQLEKVLFNLLSNSFKFTLPGGKIIFRLTENSDEVKISIVDNGIGIPLEDQEGIFTNFYQGSRYNPGNIGTGIGLAFSKSIIDLHQGSLTFKSNPAGSPGEQQTEFIITLKKGADHFEPSGLVSTKAEEIVAVAGFGTAVNEGFNYEELALNSADLTRYTILVVEDNEEVRDFIIESLKGCYSVTGCENGLMGYNAAIAHIPDLIITDVMMPEMDGMELCRKIKSDQRTNHIPVIMLTARFAPAHELRGLETGADAYISKPFSLEILLINIRNLLISRQVMREKFSQQLKLQPRDVIIPSKDGEFLNKLITMIEEHMEDPDFGVAELATEIGMSQPVLYRKVKALTDLSVADFIKSIRLKRAANLLAQQKLTIADVAYAVGFNNRKHFSKEFRKLFNENPKNFISRTANVPVTDVMEEDDD